jgi:hypothetical protein
MAGRLFDKWEQEAFRAGVQARTQQSMDWFKTRVGGLNVSRQNLIRQGPQRSRRIMGAMMMFTYDPKLKKTLPFYDRFPLCIPVQKAKGGFHGLNLHYLPPSTRAQFLDALYDTRTNDKFDLSTKMRLEYQLLKGTQRLRWFKPCFKHYLTKHIQGQFLLVEPQDWEIAIFLPTESFRKVGKTSVWSQSGVA